ncbi:MAG: serine protease [Myxococcota bacterium]|nr:serine protease [Deltaproteobacteria bacterium]MDQ3339506.1 serine protease [Myxococcota bacterium]
MTEVEVSADEAAILGGSDVMPGKWSDAAAIRTNNNWYCTGTLIAPNVVLTAGHCNEDLPNNVLVGTSSLSRPTEGEVIPVKTRIEYPLSQRNADLLVLVLERDSKFEPRPIATGWARAEIKNGAQVQIVGFGAIDRDGNQYTPSLKEATTSITDFDCSLAMGCKTPIKPAGELGAGGMGIDTCGGDSGGPLYLATDFGVFLAGATSRGYSDNQFYCSEGGIYVRPDKFVEWIEQAAGVKVRRAPEPTAEPITAVRGHAGETKIEHNDPKSKDHSFAITTPPVAGAAAVRSDGRVRVCTSDMVGAASVVVTVTDKNNPARTADIKIPITAEDGEAGEDCDPNDFGDGGGCCDSGRSAGGALPLALGVLAMLRRRRRSVR